MNNTLVMPFENGQAAIQLPTLKETVEYSQAKGELPKNRPIEHHALIDTLASTIIGTNGLTAVVNDIYVPEKNTMSVMWKKDDGPTPIKNSLIQRLATKIDMKYADSKEHCLSIGIGYSELGITIAVGANVFVCSNMHIFGENIFQTHGKDKMPFGGIMQIVNAWILQHENNLAKYEDTITKLKTIEMGDNTKSMVFGKLMERAVMANATGNHSEAPLNQSQVAEFIRTSKSEAYAVADRPMTAWDVVQWGTEILKPAKADATTVWKDNNMFCNFVLKEFNLN